MVTEEKEKIVEEGKGNVRLKLEANDMKGKTPKGLMVSEEMQFLYETFLASSSEIRPYTGTNYLMNHMANT